MGQRRQTVYEYAASRGIDLPPTEPTVAIKDYGSHILGLEEKLITLGVAKYTQDPSDYSPDKESVKALMAYQLARNTYKEAGDDVFETEREKVISNLPHTD